MKIQRVEKGVKAVLPCSILSGKTSDGWTIAQPSGEGLIVVLSDSEWNEHGCFLSDEILEKHGYIFVGKNIEQKLATNHSKSSLITMLNVLGKKDSKNAKKNKKQLAETIIKEILKLQK